MNKNQVFTVLQNAGGIRAARIITENTNNFSKIKTLYFAHLLRRGMPVAKIIKQKWFYGLNFYTNRHTLDPRPETETLVSAVISDHQATSGLRILDLGTGTGCIICALVKNLDSATGLAIDKSRHALRVARRNIAKFNIADRIKTTKASFNRRRNLGTKYDIIVSNPPYIARNDPRVNIGATHDPKMALYASNNGLAAYQSIARNATEWITDTGKLYLEIGQGQAPAIKNIFIQSGWTHLRSEYDLLNIERVLVFQRSRP